MIHLVMIPFSGVGKGTEAQGWRGQEWFDYRIKIFKEYTLKSLMNQTNKNFLLWLTFRKEERENPSVYRLLNYLSSIKVPAVFTYNGLMYHDDRAPEINESLTERLRTALLDLSKVLSPSETIYLTRLDSDDMLARNAVQEIQSCGVNTENIQALTFQNGYIYNSETRELALWNPTTNPPFHTIIFPADTFFNAKAHRSYYKDFITHEDIPRVFNSFPLPDRSYCVVIHGKHISTSWEHRFKGDMVLPHVKESILHEFGITVQSK